MLLANGQVGLHEQIRLQPFIAGSIDAPVAMRSTSCWRNQVQGCRTGCARSRSREPGPSTWCWRPARSRTSIFSGSRRSAVARSRLGARWFGSFGSTNAGPGYSDRPTNAATLEERTDDIRAVMDAVGLESAVIFGRSRAARWLACLLRHIPSARSPSSRGGRWRGGSRTSVTPGGLAPPSTPHCSSSSERTGRRSTTCGAPESGWAKTRIPSWWPSPCGRARRERVRRPWWRSNG